MDFRPAARLRLGETSVRKFFFRHGFRKRQHQEKTQQGEPRATPTYQRRTDFQRNRFSSKASGIRCALV